MGSYRQLRLLFAFAIVVLLAGCAGSATSVDNPWDRETVSVAVAGNGSQELQTATQHAIDYWNTNGSEHTTYPVEFAYSHIPEDADIVVRPVDHPLECGNHTGSNIAGCAPLLDADADPADPAVVQIVEDQPEPAARSTMKHELGHIVGLEHGDAPTGVMSTEGALTERQSRVLQNTNVSAIETRLEAQMNEWRKNHNLREMAGDSDLRSKARQRAKEIATANWSTSNTYSDSGMELGCRIELDNNSYYPDGTWNMYSTPLYSFVGVGNVDYSTGKYVSDPSEAVGLTITDWERDGTVDQAKHYTRHGIGVYISDGGHMTAVRAIC